MAVQAVLGTQLAISAGVPATQDQAGYDALSWTTAGEIVDLGEYGAVSALITHTPIGTGVVNKFKGSVNYGSVTIQMGEDTADGGQQIMDAAQLSPNDYAFRVTAQDGDIDYFQAKVMSKTVNVGSVDSIRTSSVQIEIVTPIVDA